MRERRSDGQEMATWGLTTLANTMTVEVVVRLIAAVALERQILLISESKERRSSVAFALLALLLPAGLRWKHTFLPLVPHHLYPLVEAPTPYILGVPSWDAVIAVTGGRALPTVTVVELDRGWAEERTPPPGSSPISFQAVTEAEKTAEAALAGLEHGPEAFPPLVVALHPVLAALSQRKAEERVEREKQGTRGHLLSGHGFHTLLHLQPHLRQHLCVTRPAAFCLLHVPPGSSNRSGH